MAASDVLLDQLNKHNFRFQASRSGNLEPNPINLQLSGKAGTLDFVLLLDNKQVKEGTLESCLTEADRIELLSIEELQEEYRTNTQQVV